MDNYIFPFLWMRGEPEAVIREEMERIYECGIRAVCVEARPHDDFCGPGWWHDMDIVIDEAKKRGMKIWILDDKHFPTGYAAGLIEQHPERKKWFLADTTADIFGGQKPHTLNVKRMMKPVIGFWQIGAPANYAERENNRLLAVVASPYTEENALSEETIDLTDTCDGDFANFTLPEGQWRVHVIYRTRTDGGREDYINMMDRVSAHTQIEGVYEAHYEHYKDEFGKTIAGFFSDEPELGNTTEVGYDAKVGKKGLPLPWSDELEAMLKERCGEKCREFLPFLFERTDAMRLCPQMRYDYMDCVTRLYEENFSRPIGEWCREHGVEYIGHVVEDCGSHSRTGNGAGHWFRAMAGQDMAGIDIIGSQVIFGAPVQTRKGMGGMEIDGEFFHYILGKLGASSGHLDPLKKGRTMCELFGAYGWNFGVRDMKYLLDHLLSRGVNHLVPHAFSMAEYPDIDCPPHFYARGNNAQFPWFARLMRYANRMCGLLNGGTHAASVAVLYDGEEDWVGDHMPMQKIGRVLTEHQIEFDVVPMDMLNDLARYSGKLEGRRLVINGVEFDALLVPRAQYIPYELAEFTRNSGEFPVWFVGGYPEAVLCRADGASQPDGDDWKENSVTVTPEGLPALLQARRMAKVTLEPAASHVTLYHYRKEGRQIFMFMNESSDRRYSGTVSLPCDGPLVHYDGLEDRFWDVQAQKAGAENSGQGPRCAAALDLEPGESCVIMEKRDESCAGVWSPAADRIAACTQKVDLADGWKVELITAKEYLGVGSGQPEVAAAGETAESSADGEANAAAAGGTAKSAAEAHVNACPRPVKQLAMSRLAPVSDSEPKFSGVIRYTREFELAEIPAQAYFRAEHVYEVMRVAVNGEEAGVCLTPPYQADVQSCLKAGRNTIMVEVANTPGRDQLNYPMPPFDFSHEALEPSGMFGDVALYLG